MGDIGHEGMDASAGRIYTSPTMPRRFHFLRTYSKLILWIVVVLFLGSLLLIPTIHTVIHGRQRPVQMFRNISSDGRFEITTSSRVALPANEVMDPAVIASITLREVATGKKLETQEARLEEESNLQDPLVIWSDRVIRVSQFDSLQPDRQMVFKR